MREADWFLAGLGTTTLPPGKRAWDALTDALDRWDETAAGRAAATFARSADRRTIFETPCSYGSRDYRDIGHKAIYLANGWRNAAPDLACSTPRR
jgi:hypothetical protein